MRPLQILTALLHVGFSMALQRGFPYNEDGHRGAPDNDHSKVRKGHVGHGGCWGGVVGVTQPSRMLQSNMSEIIHSGRLCRVVGHPFHHRSVPVGWYPDAGT